MINFKLDVLYKHTVNNLNEEAPEKYSTH